MQHYIMNPVDYAIDVLRVEPQEWQADALNNLAHNPRLAIRAGHGVGKTAFESWAVLWFLTTRPYAKVPCTAPTRQQLNDILWSEIQKWIDQSYVKDYIEWTKTKIIIKGHPGRWFATARTATKPENMAGFHDAHLLFVVDEASGVKDPIFETIEGALTTEDAKLLLCGNPTQNTGVFHDAFYKDRALYVPMKVSCLDSPLVTPEYAERLKKKYREDSDVYRVRVLGEFPKSDPDSLIPLEWVERALMKEIGKQIDGGVLKIGADIARFGNDETVIAGQINNVQIAPLQIYSKQDTMQTAGRILAHAREWASRFHCESVQINIDDSGVGGGVTDRLNELRDERQHNFRIVAVNNGERAFEDEKYENKGTENWHRMRDLLEFDELVLLEDEDMVGQLATRKFKMTSRGRIALERKEDMKKRGLMSPDRADAIILAFYDEPDVQIVFDEPTVVSYDDIMNMGYDDIFD